MEFIDLLKLVVQHEGSDLIVKTNALPRIRKGGDLHDLPKIPAADEAQIKAWVKEILPARLTDRLNTIGDADFTLQGVPGHRFRVNLFRQRQTYSIVVRVITNKIPELKNLNLPDLVGELATSKRGLILVTGATGSGKSTTLGGMVQKINRERPAHIITIEDPIEFSYEDIAATINQREVGLDIASFPDALRSAMRQNPDVILIGELRDKETIKTALQAAETGHLVLSTLHTSDSVETISRILSYFSGEEHHSLRVLLSTALRAIISQRLVPRKNNKGVVPATEILVGSSHVRDLIARSENLKKIYDAIDEGSVYGMHPFDDSLLELYRKRLISSKEAIRQASRPTDLELRIKGILGSSA